MIECLKNLSGDSEMTVRVVYECPVYPTSKRGWRWVVDGWIGMRIKPEKPYSVRLERLYSSNDLGAFLDILSITLSFFLGFVLLSVVVVLLRSWLYY